MTGRVEITVAELLTRYRDSVGSLVGAAEAVDGLPPVAVCAAMIRAAMMYAAGNSVCPACLRDMLGNARAALPDGAHAPDDGPGLDDDDDDDGDGWLRGVRPEGEA